MADHGEMEHCRPACTAHKSQVCRITKCLSNCNELLFHVGMELRKERGGSLSLVSFQSFEAEVIPAPDPYLRQAKAFLRWLLRTHICISSLELIYKGVRVHSQTILEELPENSRLKKLKVEFLLGDHSQNYIATLLPRLHCLEELNFVMSVSTDALVAAMSALLRNTTRLNTLVFIACFENGQPPQAFVDALAANSTLKTLELWANWNTNEPPGCLGEYVRSNGLLTKLKVHGENVDRADLLLDEALVRNCTLTTLDVSLVSGGERSVCFLTRILAECPALTKLTLGDVLNKYITIYEATLTRCGQALTENETLEELTLPYAFWHPTNWISFFALVAENKHLKKVEVSHHRPSDYQTSPPVLEALTRLNLSQRVSFGEYMHVSGVNLMHFRAFTGITILGTVSALRRLPALDHFTRLSIDLRTSMQDLFTALAKYIRATTVLRELRLAVSNPANSAPSLWWTSVFDSLSVNTSIGFLVIASCENLLHNDRLASTIGLSSYITRVCYLQGREEWDPTSFVLPLSDATGDNNNLLKVELPGAKVGDDAARGLLKIKETVRRNCGLLERAAAFNQTTTLDWCTATALEQVSRRPALVRELAEKEGTAACEVARMVRSRLRSVDGLNDYMRLTGVVKERVTCALPVQVGSTQLDDLNIDCWRLLRQYLSFDDVKGVTITN